MSFSDIYSIAGSGMTAQTVRLNTVASNLANADAVAGNPNDVYKALKPVFASVYNQTQLGAEQSTSSGAQVRVVDVIKEQGHAAKRFEPNNPLANKEGYVFYPDVDTVSEMADMMAATRSFQSNVAVLTNVRSMQQGLLRLGESS